MARYARARMNPDLPLETRSKEEIEHIEKRKKDVISRAYQWAFHRSLAIKALIERDGYEGLQHKWAEIDREVEYPFRDFNDALNEAMFSAYILGCIVSSPTSGFSLEERREMDKVLQKALNPHGALGGGPQS